MTREEILQTAKPILFNTDMVQAILEGRKAETRRIMKPQPILQNGLWLIGFAGWSDRITSVPVMPGHSLYKRAPYKLGDYLYIRETWKSVEANIFHCQTPPPRVPEVAYGYEYKADNGYFWKDGFSIDDVYRVEISSYKQWRPSIHMPKEAARIFLRVTDIRIEWLQAMTLDDFLSEGIILRAEAFNDPENAYQQAKRIFIDIWDSTVNELKYKWNANPWTWAIGFERVEVRNEQETA